jgi:dTDP-4-dehydrorhamnose 3,5-epimerase
MHFTPAELPGVYLIEPERLEDERGFFARTWCQQEFTAHQLDAQLTQCNISFNVRRGTLRGLHFQMTPHAEAKVIRCTMGAIYDVAVDLRPDSPTFKRWLAVELTAQNRTMVYLPHGVAHGLQTLEDNSEVFYQMSEVYHPECARGVRWNDAAFGIRWPLEPTIISLKDQQYPDFAV